MLAFAAFSCSASKSPAVTLQPPAPVNPGTASKIPAPGQWDKLLSSARAEGKVVIVTSMGPEVKGALVKAFQDKYGIEVDFMIMRGQETVVKLQNERRAGIYVNDLVIGGTTTLTGILVPAGYLEPVEPNLFLPEVTDPKVWWNGKLPLTGYGHGISVMKYVNIPIAINTDLVKPEEIRSYRDLLNPKWKGKIVMDDPTVTGSGGKLASYILKEGIAGGEEFLRGLVRQDPVINRDRRLVAEWLARGKYAIAIAARPEMVKPLLEIGMPLKWLTPQEGTYVTSGGGNASLLKNPLHPNAARLFLNWVLTRESAILWSKATDTQSAREDVPTDFLSQDHVRKPGVKYVDSDTEEFEVQNAALFEASRAIFAPILK